MRTRRIRKITRQHLAAALFLAWSFISCGYAHSEPLQNYTFAVSAFTNCHYKGQESRCSQKSLNDSFEAGRNVVLLRELGICAAKIAEACTYCDNWGRHKGSQIAVGEDCQGGFNVAVVGVDPAAVHLVSPQQDKSPVPKDVELEARRLLSISLEDFDYPAERKTWLRKVLNDQPKALRVEPGILLLFMKTKSTLSKYMYATDHRRWLAKSWEHEEPVLVVNNSVLPLPATKGHLFFSVNDRLHLVCTLLHPHSSHSNKCVYDLSSGTVRMVYDQQQTRRKEPATSPSVEITKQDVGNRQGGTGTGLVLKTLKGKVKPSSPNMLELQVTGNGATQAVLIRVGLKTNFFPFRRPVVGETVEVQYQDENGSKFGHVVKIID